jgi:hypothetical protein
VWWRVCVESGLVRFESRRETRYFETSSSEGWERKRGAGIEFGVSSPAERRCRSVGIVEGAFRGGGR